MIHRRKQTTFIDVMTNEQYRQAMLRGLMSGLPTLEMFTLVCARNWLADCLAAPDAIREGDGANL
jgi:hypothetical protein